MKPQAPLPLRQDRGQVGAMSLHFRATNPVRSGAVSFHAASLRMLIAERSKHITPLIHVRINSGPSVHAATPVRQGSRCSTGVHYISDAQ